MEKTEQFTELYIQNERHIYRYIASLLPNVDDIDGILKETSKHLHEAFEDFDPDKPFLNWAFKFAYREVQKYRKFGKQEQFSDDLIETLSILQETELERFRELRQNLTESLLNLDDTEIKLIEAFYTKNDNKPEVNSEALEELRIKLLIQSRSGERV